MSQRRTASSGFDRRARVGFAFHGPFDSDLVCIPEEASLDSPFLVVWPGVGATLRYDGFCRLVGLVARRDHGCASHTYPLRDTIVSQCRVVVAVLRAAQSGCGAP